MTSRSGQNSGTEGLPDHGFRCCTGAMTSLWMGAGRGTVRSLALLVPVVVAALLGLARGEFASSVAAIVLVIPVVAAAATGDRWAGVLAAGAGAVAFDYFLTTPYFSLSIARAEGVELAVALVLVGVAVTELSLWGHRQSAAAAQRQKYLDDLAALLDLPPDPTGRMLPTAICRALTTVLGIDRAEWLDGAPLADEAVIEPDGVVRLHGRALPVQAEGLPIDGTVTIPVSRAGQVVGRFRLVAASRAVWPRTEELRTAVLLANSVVREFPEAPAHSS